MMAEIKKSRSNYFVLFWIAALLNIILSLMSFIYFDNFIPIFNAHLMKLNHDFTYVIIGQYFLIVLAVDFFIQASYQRFNRIFSDRSIPQVITESTRWLIWIIGALICYASLKGGSMSAVWAASGGMGVGVFYVFRERLADMASYIDMRIQGLVSEGDWLHIIDAELNGRFQVISLNKKIVTIQSLDDKLIRKINNSRFVDFDYVNLTKQLLPNLDRRKLSIDLRFENNSEKVLSVIRLTLEYLHYINKEFSANFELGMSDFREGYIEYQIRYYCNVEMSVRRSEDAFMSAFNSFARLASIDFSSALLPCQSNQDDLDNKNKLLNVYKQSLLKVLSKDEIISLSNKVDTIYTEANEQLIKRDDLADSMYIITEGSLDVSIINNEGEAVIVASLWPGQCVGEMSLLTGAPRSADVYSRTAATLLEIKKQDLAPILKNNPALIGKISQDLTAKLALNAKLANQKQDEEKNEDASKGLANKILKFFFQ